MYFKFISLLLTFSIALTAHGADFYKWTDEAGTTHFGDAAPIKPSDKAIKILPTVHEPSAADRQQALNRAAKAKAQDQENMARLAKENEAQPNTVKANGSTISAEKKSTYAEDMKKYHESQECFAPFHNTNGKMKPGAYEQCTEVPLPLKGPNEY